jgi:O-antigen ligase
LNRTDFHIKAHQVLLLSIAFSLPFPLLYSNILIFITLANHLAAGNLISKFKNTWKNEINRYLLSFYLLIVISVILNPFNAESSAILERRLVFLAFPILLSEPIHIQQFRKILYAFVIGVFIALSYCLLASSYQYFVTADVTNLFYHSLAAHINLNAIYLSAYIVFSIFILVDSFPNTHTKYRILLLLAALVFLIGLILLSSKMMLFVSLLGFFYLLYKNIQWSKMHRMILLFSTLAIFTLIFTIPQVRNRFALEIASNLHVVNQQEYTYNTPFTGTTLRLTIWKYCYVILERNHAWMMGVGVGHFQELLNQEYKAVGMYTGNPQLKDTGYLGYGPHNQYIETLFSMGIIGLLLFLLLILRQLLKSVQTVNAPYILFVALHILFFLSESSLSTNKGIIFYAFFTMVFASLTTKNKQELIESPTFSFR